MANKTSKKSAKVAKKATQKSAKSQPTAKKAAARPGPGADKDGENAVLATIAKMPEPYRAMGERLHAIIKASAPALSPKTWYGLPAYAKNGKVVCYLRMNPKPPFNDRYMTFGFNETANLDQGAMWPIVFALKDLTAAEEAKVGVLVKKAVS